MQTFVKAFLFLCVLSTLPMSAFARSLNCEFKGEGFEGVKSIRITANSMLINSNLEIPLQKTEVNCANFGKQVQLDGQALGYQVSLDSCNFESSLSGALIDSVNVVAASVVCNPI